MNPKLRACETVALMPVPRGGTARTAGARLGQPLTITEEGPSQWLTNMPRLLTIAVPDYGLVSADVAAKSLRRAQNAIVQHGSDGVACVLQGKLASSGKIIEAGLVAQVKQPKPGRGGGNGMRERSVTQFVMT